MNRNESCGILGVYPFLHRSFLGVNPSTWIYVYHYHHLGLAMTPTPTVHVYHDKSMSRHEHKDSLRFIKYRVNLMWQFITPHQSVASWGLTDRRPRTYRLMRRNELSDEIDHVLDES